MKGWLHDWKRPALALTLSVSLFLSACGLSFASQLRLITAASTPFIDSLNLGEHRAALIADFSTLTNGAADLKDSLDVCSGKPCKLNAVEVYERLFESVEAHGNFRLHAKLQNVERILRGIISTAKVYYGGTARRSNSAGALPAKSMDAQLQELREAMQP